MATGKITQIIGAVIDVEFPRDSIPKIYEALKLKDGDLTLEVQQQLGDGVVRTIAMGASEGLKRGLEVETTDRQTAPDTMKKAPDGFPSGAVFRSSSAADQQL